MEPRLRKGRSWSWEFDGRITLFAGKTFPPVPPEGTRALPPKGVFQTGMLGRPKNLWLWERQSFFSSKTSTFSCVSCLKFHESDGLPRNSNLISKELESPRSFAGQGNWDKATGKPKKGKICFPPVWTTLHQGSGSRTKTDFETTSQKKKLLRSTESSPLLGKGLAEFAFGKPPVRGGQRKKKTSGNGRRGKWTFLP